MAADRTRWVVRIHALLAAVTLLVGQTDAQDRAAELEILNKKLDYLRKELIEKPDDFQLLITLATALHQTDHSFPDGGSRIPEAERVYRRAIKVAPTTALASVLEGNLGALLMSAGRLEEALDKIDSSILASTASGRLGAETNVGAIFNKGKALGMLGREAESQAAYRQAMQLSKGRAPSTWTKSCASLREASPEELEQMEAAATFLEFGTGLAKRMKSKQHAGKQMAAALLQEEWGWLENTDFADQSWLYFALFSAFDKKGEYDKAWGYLQIANRLQSGNQAEDGQQDEELINILMSIFTEPISGEASSTYQTLLSGLGGCPDETPVFVVGMPRSGSTLIEQILSSHPQVFGAGEDTALAPLMPSLFKVLEGDNGQVSLRAVAAIGETYVREMRRRLPEGQSPLKIVDKMLRNAWNIGHIAFILPKAKFLWAVRHPMDVVLSCFAQPFEGRGTSWAWDLEEIALQVELTHKIMSHWERIVPGRILRVPYEEVVGDQKAASKKLLAHCGLPWNPSVLKFHKKERSVLTASQSQVRRELYTTSVSRWKKYSKHLQAVKERLEPLIQQYEEVVIQPFGGKSDREEL